MKLRRIFHHFEKCEEYKSNMWKVVPIETREQYTQAAAALMKDVSAFESAMMSAVDQWPNSCEANLTASSMNHQAWMGHAGCAIKLGAPEDLVRKAWRTLTKDQQDAANAAADRVIAAWTQKYIRERKHAKTRLGGGCIDSGTGTNQLHLFAF